MRQGGLIGLVAGAVAAFVLVLGGWTAAGAALPGRPPVSSTTADLIAGGPIEGTVDLDSLGPGETLRGAPVGVQAVAFSSHGDLVAAGGLSTRVVVWSTGNGRVERVLRVPEAVPIWSLAFSPDGRLVAAGGDDGGVRLWREREERPWRLLRASASPVESLAFAPDGRTLASVGRDRVLRAWTVATGAPAGPFRRAPAGTSLLAYSARTGEAMTVQPLPGATDADRSPDSLVRLWRRARRLRGGAGRVALREGRCG